jgi:hypothetical protein
MTRTLLMLSLSVLVSLAAPAASFDHSHAAFDALLRQRVRDGRVDYPALKADPKPLNDYLDQLGAVSEAEFKRWREPERLAFLINLYNAVTLKLVVDHEPVKSIRNIGRLFSSPFKRDVAPLFGGVVSLDTVEHEILRKQYSEPRIHFALVCAALSCPELRAEAYVGARLNEQLRDQGERFLRDPRRNRVDLPGRTLSLSEIFKWFREDFEKSGKSVQQFLADYLPPEAAAVARRDGFRIRHLKYDWSLNDR